MPENSKFIEGEDKELTLSRERRIEFCREFVDEMRGRYFRGARRIAEEIYSGQITAEEMGSTPEEIRDLLRGAAEELVADCRSNIAYFNFEDLKRLIHLCGFSLKEIGMTQHEFDKFTEMSRPEAQQAEHQKQVVRAKEALDFYLKDGDLRALERLAAMIRYWAVYSREVGITDEQLYEMCFKEAEKILDESRRGELQHFNILRGFVEMDIMTENALGTNQKEMHEFFKRELQLRKQQKQI